MVAYAARRTMRGAPAKCRDGRLICPVGPVRNSDAVVCWLECARRHRRCGSMGRAPTAIATEKLRVLELWVSCCYSSIHEKGHTHVLCRW